MQYINIDLTAYHSDFKLKDSPGSKLILCLVRKRWFTLNAEEVVRQSILYYLINERLFSINRLAVEKEIPYFDGYKRFDILYYDKHTKPIFLVECKSHKIPLNQKVLDQISIYNQTLKVPYLMVSNGIQNICIKLDFNESKYTSLSEIPYSEELESFS